MGVILLGECALFLSLPDRSLPHLAARIPSFSRARVSWLFGWLDEYNESVRVCLLTICRTLRSRSFKAASWPFATRTVHDTIRFDRSTIAISHSIDCVV